MNELAITLATDDLELVVGYTIKIALTTGIKPSLYMHRAYAQIIEVFRPRFLEESHEYN